MGRKQSCISKTLRRHKTGSGSDPKTGQKSFPAETGTEEISQEASKTAKRAAAAAQQAKEEELTVLNIRGADIATETVEYKKNADLYEKEAMDFVNTLSEEDLIDLAEEIRAKHRVAILAQQEFPFQVLQVKPIAVQ